MNDECGFGYVAGYGTIENAVAIHGRIFGAVVASYLVEQQQTTVRWRLLCEYVRIDKKRVSQ